MSRKADISDPDDGYPAEADTLTAARDDAAVKAATPDVHPWDAAGAAIGPLPKPQKERLWTKDFILGTFINFFFSANYFMLMVVMTAYAMDEYGAPASFAGFVASIFIIGTLFARLASPPVMEALGRKRLLFGGAALILASTCLYFIDLPLPGLIALRFVHGFAFGLSSTCDATIVTAMVPRHRKGEGIGYYMLSATLGAAVGPSAGILVSRYMGYPTLFTVAAAIIVVALIGIVFLRVAQEPAGAGKRAKADEKDIIAAEDDIAGDLAAAPAEAAREEAPRAQQAQATEAQRAKGILRLIEPKIFAIGSVCGLIFFGYSSLLTFLTPYAETIGLTRAASVFFVAYALSMFITRPFTGRAFDRFGPMPIMPPAFIAFIAGMALLSFSTNDWMLLGSALLLGYGVGTIQSCGLSMAVRTVPDARLSVANATFYMMIDAGVGIGPVFLGLIVPIVGYQALYWCMAGVGLVSLVLFAVIMGRKAGKEAA